MMTMLMTGAVLGIVLVLAGIGALYALAGPDPPAEPPLETEDERDYHELFRSSRWTKVTFRAAPPDRFNRPLEIEPETDHGLMPPPRRVEGVNGEE